MERFRELVRELRKSCNKKFDFDLFEAHGNRNGYVRGKLESSADAICE